MLLKLPKPTAPQWIGLGLIWLGGATAARWVFLLPALQQLIPGFSEMGLVSPLMFLASGAACILLGAPAPRRAVWRVRAVLGCIGLLLVFSSLMLVEYLLGVPLGVDFVRDGIASAPTVAFPGRMSPNACVAFGLAGLGMHLMLRRATAWRRKVLLVLIVGVAFIGVAGCIGYVLRFERLYRLAQANALSPPVAYGLTFLSAGLWLLRERWVASDASGLQRHEQRIGQRSVAVLAVVAIAAGVSGFAVIQETYEKSQADGMLLTASDNADALASLLEEAGWLPRTIATRPAVSLAFNLLQSRPGDRQQAEVLRAAGQSFLNASLRGVRFENNAGAELATVGQLTVKRADVSLALAPDSSGRRLAWNDGYVLVSTQPVFEQGRQVGRIVTEQDLPLFDKLVVNVRWAGDASDALVCRRDAAAVACLSSQPRMPGSAVPVSAADQRFGLPVSRALRGQPGIAFERKGPWDTPLVAAYTPIGATGLVMLVKTNAEALYAPLRGRVNVLALTLVGLVAFGWLAMNSQVRPLVAQMAAGERRTRVILENSNDAFIAVDADGLITDWNSGAQRTFGWGSHEAIGQRLSGLIVPPDQRAAHEERFARFRASGSSPVLNRRVEVTALHRDGHIFMAEWLVAALQENGGHTAHAFVRDITERLAAQNEIASSERRLRDITDNLPVLIGYIDSGRKLIFANRMFEHWFGLDPAALAGRPIGSLGTPIYSDRPDKLDASLAGERVEYEFACQAADGQSRTLHTVLVPDAQPDGRVAGVYALSTDVSANKAVEQHLNQLARVDPLTGLPNRRQFEERLEQSMARCRRGKRPMALIFMDIDRFKGINDSLGHGVGDAVLREFAHRLESGIRITDLAARLAGDEFVVVAEGLNTVGEASLIAQKLVEAIRQPMVVKGETLQVTTSMGLAYYTGHEGTAEEVTARADRALYRAKDAGRDTFAATVF